jgi:hypothetical protein
METQAQKILKEAHKRYSNQLRPYERKDSDFNEGVRAGLELAIGEIEAKLPIGNEGLEFFDPAKEA